MASKKSGNGHSNGETQSAMLEVLKAIHADLGQTNARLEAIEQVQRGQGKQLLAIHETLKEQNATLREQGERLENIRDVAGERFHKLETRVQLLEDSMRFLHGPPKSQP